MIGYRATAKLQPSRKPASLTAIQQVIDTVWIHRQPLYVYGANLTARLQPKPLSQVWLQDLSGGHPPPCVKQLPVHGKQDGSDELHPGFTLTAAAFTGVREGSERGLDPRCNLRSIFPEY
eukprot:3937305-Rhodomonas_salina.15